jgi:hypothetical protein
MHKVSWSGFCGEARKYVVEGFPETPWGIRVEGIWWRELMD